MLSETQSRNYAGFQSPSGVLGVCRACFLVVRKETDRLVVSVPFRGFRGLQAGGSAETPGKGCPGFQSPSGVLGVCRLCNSVDGIVTM